MIKPIHYKIKEKINNQLTTIRHSLSGIKYGKYSGEVVGARRTEREVIKSLKYIDNKISYYNQKRGTRRDNALIYLKEAKKKVLAEKAKGYVMTRYAELGRQYYVRNDKNNMPVNQWRHFKKLMLEGENGKLPLLSTNQNVFTNLMLKYRDKLFADEQRLLTTFYGRLYKIDTPKPYEYRSTSDPKIRMFEGTIEMFKSKHTNGRWVNESTFYDADEDILYYLEIINVGEEEEQRISLVDILDSTWDGTNNYNEIIEGLRNERKGITGYRKPKKNVYDRSEINARYYKSNKDKWAQAYKQKMYELKSKKTKKIVKKERIYNAPTDEELNKMSKEPTIDTNWERDYELERQQERLERLERAQREREEEEDNRSNDDFGYGDDYWSGEGGNE